MYLASDRQWFTTWHPAVHSLVRLQYGTKAVELPHIAGPLQLDGVNEQNLAKVVQLNHEMTGLLPYNGGSIEIVAGLLAIQGDNALPRLIGVLSSFGGMLQVPQLSAGLAIAGPLATGIQGLLTGGSGELALGLHQTFTQSEGGGANEPVPGYFAVLLATGAALSPDALSVDSDRLRIGTNGTAPTPLSGIPYMLFRLDRLTERADWEGLQELVEPFDQATNALLVDQAPDRAEALARLGTALVLRSPDLTRADRVRVARKLKERYDYAKGLGAGAVPAQLQPWPEAIAQAPPVEGYVSELDVDLAYGELWG